MTPTTCSTTTYLIGKPYVVADANSTQWWCMRYYNGMELSGPLILSFRKEAVIASKRSRTALLLIFL